MFMKNLKELMSIIMEMNPRQTSNVLAFAKGIAKR